MNDLNIYLQFLGHVRQGDSANKCAWLAQKLKKEIYETLAFTLNFSIL